jgi:low affinity Fe/Cu permease
MQDIEKKFILLSASFIQWKAQSIAILEIVYQHKVRHSEEQKQEFVEIKQKIEEKYDNIAEYYVNDIKKILPYKTEYKNFKEAVKHLQKKDV